MDSKTLRSPISILNPAKPICVNSDAPISDAIAMMRDKHIGCVCVVEDNHLVGILTERDILKKIVGGKLDINATRVANVMTASPEYLFEDDQLAFALNRMHVGGFRHIPLINLKGQPTGLISVRDIIRHLVNNVDLKN